MTYVPPTPCVGCGADLETNQPHSRACTEVPRRRHGYAPPEYPRDGRCTICGQRRDEDIHDEG